MTGLKRRQTMWTPAAICAGVMLGLAGDLWAQTATRPAAAVPTGDEVLRYSSPQAGKIKGDNVYVRSGSHLSYYPVTKLNRGDQVTAVGEQYGWLEILPPAGTFSLIDKTYVDRTGDDGTVNDSRWVFAGSNLDNRRYTKQVKLNKGDKVRILGETPDGAFLKIEPPGGASVWVKGEFVEGVTMTGASPAPQQPVRVPPGSLGLDGELEPVATQPGGIAAATTRPFGEDGIVMSSRTPAARTAAGRRPSGRPEQPPKANAGAKYQPKIDAIEAEMAAINAKDPADRNYNPIISKLQPIADQKEDEVASLYASARISQIRSYLDAQTGLQQIEQMRDEAIRNANEIARRRAALPPAKRVLPADEIIVRGEIRASIAYSGQAGIPRRWRVVEPDAGSNAPTLAYIELPPGSSIDPTEYYNKYVGIKASAHRVMSGTVQPIPIYTVAEIVLLDSSSRTRPGRVGGSTAYASPGAPSVRAPASGPAATIEEPE